MIMQQPWLLRALRPFFPSWMKSAVFGVLALLSCSVFAVDSPPQRIVSLDLCMDWNLAYHANPNQIAALSPLVHQYPVDWLQPTWPTHDGSLEHIVQLQPDLILVGEYSAFLLRERLKSLGYRVEVLPLPTSLEQIEDYERRFFQLIGLNPDHVPAAPHPQTPTATAKRILILESNGMGTGRDTFEHQIIELAGWQNYIDASYRVALDLEQLLSEPPDAIVFNAPNARALANRFAEHPVLQRSIPQEQWITVEDWRWQCPGSWSWDLIRQLQP